MLGIFCGRVATSGVRAVRDTKIVTAALEGLSGAGAKLGNAFVGWTKGFGKGAGQNVGAAESAFSLASRGGRHAGFLNRAMSMSSKELQRTSNSLQKRIEIHEGYLANPAIHVPNWRSLRPGHQQSLLNHWGQEISTFAEQQSIVEQLLR